MENDNKEKSANENNLSIWDSVCETDPDHTKKVEMRGGYTAIDPQYQLHRATELWGPYGGKWGVKDLVWQIIETGEPKKSLSLDATFFAPGVSFPISVCMLFRHGDDTRKKLLTSARSKALSMLGFNADIYLGMYEDSTYLGNMKVKFEEEGVLRETIAKHIRTSKTVGGLAKVRNRLDELRGNDTINQTFYAEGIQLVDQQERELANG